MSSQRGENISINNRVLCLARSFSIPNARLYGPNFLYSKAVLKTKSKACKGLSGVPGTWKVLSFPLPIHPPVKSMGHCPKLLNNNY